jgi:hypothetical protein
MGAKPSKRAPPPPPVACNVLNIPNPNGQRDYAWVDPTGRNGGVKTSAGYVLCLKACQPGDFPEIGSDKKPTGKMIKASDSKTVYTPVVYHACSSTKCGNFKQIPGCIA